MTFLTDLQSYASYKNEANSPSELDSLVLLYKILSFLQSDSSINLESIETLLNDRLPPLNTFNPNTIDSVTKLLIDIKSLIDSSNLAITASDAKIGTTNDRLNQLYFFCTNALITRLNSLDDPDSVLAEIKDTLLSHTTKLEGIITAIPANSTVTSLNQKLCSIGHSVESIKSTALDFSVSGIDNIIANFDTTLSDNPILSVDFPTIATVPITKYVPASFTLPITTSRYSFTISPSGDSSYSSLTPIFYSFSPFTSSSLSSSSFPSDNTYFSFFAGTEELEDSIRFTDQKTLYFISHFDCFLSIKFWAEASSPSLTHSSSPNLASISIPSSNSQVYFQIPASTKRFSLLPIAPDSSASIKLYLTSNVSSSFYPLFSRSELSESSLSLSSPLTLFFISSLPNTLINIKYWS